jgi:hypothetical protein
MRRQRFSLLATAAFVSQVSTLQPSDASAAALARDTAFNKKEQIVCQARPAVCKEGAYG